MFSCFVLGKCLVNRPQAGRPNQGDKSARKFEWNGGVLMLKCFQHCIVKYFDVGPVYSTRVTILWCKP